jgi:prepilin-type N-terminal cleavage/methylation domain-containing protein
MNRRSQLLDSSRPVALGGFTLIETVVAIAILALTLALVDQSLAWAVRRGSEQRLREQAWLTAQSLLAGVRGERSPAITRRSGLTPQRLSWESTVEPYSAADYASSALRPLQVTIRVSWGERPSQHVALRSIELGANP